MTSPASTPSRGHRLAGVAALALGASIALAGCGSSAAPTGAENPSASPSVGDTVAPVETLEVTSADFVDGGGLASTFAGCNGDNLNPQLAWAAGPEGTASYAITVTDPDANNYSHWLHFNIPTDVTSVAQGASLDLPGDRGRGSSGTRAYFGPCPPSQHHYVFTVYALDTTIEATDTLIWFQFMQLIEGHVLAQGQITGLYPAE